MVSKDADDTLLLSSIDSPITTIKVYTPNKLSGSKDENEKREDGMIHVCVCLYPYSRNFNISSLLKSQCRTSVYTFCFAYIFSQAHGHLLE